MSRSDLSSQTTHTLQRRLKETIHELNVRRVGPTILKVEEHDELDNIKSFEDVVRIVARSLSRHVRS